MHFNLVDIVALSYVAVSVFIGWRNGLAAELPWAVSWALALFTGSGLYRWTARGLFSLSEATGSTLGILGFVAVLVGAYFVVKKLRLRIQQIARKRLPDEKAQQRWGAVAGGLGALLLCGFVILFISLLPIGPLRKPFTNGSFIGGVMMAIVRPVYDLTHDDEPQPVPKPNAPPKPWTAPSPSRSKPY